jgi:hypothetical protein
MALTRKRDAALIRVRHFSFANAVRVLLAKHPDTLSRGDWQIGATSGSIHLFVKSDEVWRV